MNHADSQATVAPGRVVVTGADEHGRSKIIGDFVSEAVYRSPFVDAYTIWESQELPPRPGDDHRPVMREQFEPRTGARIFVSTFPPAHVWKDDPDGVREALAAAGLTGDGTRPAGFHATATIDVQTVVYGEICCVTDEGEVVLRQGDSIVMNGVQHMWMNRSDEPATVVAVMIATPAETGEGVADE